MLMLNFDSMKFMDSQPAVAVTKKSTYFFDFCWDFSDVPEIKCISVTQQDKT